MLLQAHYTTRPEPVGGHGYLWDLWKAIEALHVQKDASLRHEAWVHLFGHRKRSDKMHPCLVAQTGIFLDVERLNRLPEIPHYRHYSRVDH